MLKDFKAKFGKFFSSGHERTLLAKKNIALSFLLKCGSIIIGFALVPLTISYINPTQYGIWITLSSLIIWLSFFDIGLGNGLKNKLTEANALKAYDKSVIYVSTTYTILTIISILLFICFVFIKNFINWAKVFNIPYDNNLNNLVLIVFGCFCIQFVMQIINVVLTAFHAPAKVSLINLIGQFVSIGLIFILTKTTNGSIINLAIILAGTPILMQFLASIWYYKFDYKIVRPRISAVNFKHIKSLLSIGGAFFIVQIGALILFETDNIIITQLFGPKQVTVFNIAYKLFATIIMGFSIVLTPFWSAYTDAYAKKDFEWMKNAVAKTRKIWMLLSIASFGLFLASPFIYKIWLNSAVTVPISVSLAMLFYTIGINWLTLHCYMLNGIGKIRIQLYIYVFSIFVNIPLSIFLAKYFGVAGVTLSNIFMFIIMGIFVWIQCNKILNNTATGIWNK